ncbi:chemotaxis protein CheW [bacterium]|nr:chemotaxis protein CheW [bacterium]
MKQYVTFHIQNHLFGIDILNVLEIFSAESITEIPKSPASVKGLVNVRGQIVTVLNLAAILQFPNVVEPYSRDIVLLKSQSDIKKRRLQSSELDWGAVNENLGLHIDWIGDIIEIEEPLSPLPPSVDSIERNYVQGVVNRGKQLLIVLSLKSIFDDL